MKRLSEQTLSSIIGDIYDCALSPEGWSGVMTRVAESIDAAYTTIALTSLSDSRGRFATHSPWDFARMQTLQDYDLEEIPGLKAAVFGDIDQPVPTLSVVTETELERSVFFQEWAKPQGLREGCTTKFVHTPDRIGLFSCTTWADRPRITDEEQQFLALLSPHLRRASLIGDLLDQSRVTASLYRGALDSLAVPVILTGADGVILHANAPANDILAAQIPLRSRNGIIQAQTPLIATALLEAISAGHDRRTPWVPAASACRSRFRGNLRPSPMSCPCARAQPALSFGQPALPSSSRRQLLQHRRRKTC